MDWEELIGKRLIVKTKNNSVFIGKMIDYDNGFDDDTNEETITIDTINWSKFPCQEIDVVDIVSVKEV